MNKAVDVALLIIAMCRETVMSQAVDAAILITALCVSKHEPCI